MPNYIIKIPVYGKTLAQAKYISGQVYDAIDLSDTIPGDVNDVYLTEGDISDTDIEQDERLDNAYMQHFDEGENKNPLPDDFPVID